MKPVPQAGRPSQPEIRQFSNDHFGATYSKLRADNDYQHPRATAARVGFHEHAPEFGDLLEILKLKSFRRIIDLIGNFK